MSNQGSPVSPAYVRSRTQDYAGLACGEFTPVPAGVRHDRGERHLLFRWIAGSGRYPQRLAVLARCVAGDVDAVALELLDDLVIEAPPAPLSSELTDAVTHGFRGMRLAVGGGDRQ